MKERFIKPDEPKIRLKLTIDDLCDMADHHLDCRASVAPTIEEINMYALVEIAKALRGVSYILDSRLEELT